jgi:D-glycero-alpha-D-manno-heptose-7-phosphate kinase
MRGERVANGQLAEEASKVEIDMLKRPIGKQDQYAAAYGGLNCMEFRPDDSVSIEPLPLGQDDISTLFNHLRLFWTGITRDSADVLGEQKRNTASRMDVLREMRDQAAGLREMTKTGFSIEKLGAHLNDNWQRKKSLANTISDQQIDAWYDTALAAGAYGGKICGAGGGGFLMLLVPPNRLQHVRQALAGLQEVSANYEPHGSLQILPHVA